jgi:predicted GH43/DUF377 family glycosyl hydrolase
MLTKRLYPTAFLAGACCCLAFAQTWVSPTFGDPPRYDWMMGPFQKHSSPVFTPSKDGLDNKNVYNMAVIQEGSTTFMVYRGESKSDTPRTNTGRLFLATSQDGEHFQRRPEPILVPDHAYESRGVEDPRLIKVEGTYYLTYTAYDGTLARLCEATSTDLLHWEKRGPIFPEFPEGNDVSPADWTKSGAIFSERIQDGPYKGKYVMYFGESDMWMAYSDDLLHWSYLKEPVIRRRPDRGDSRVCEPGPPPIRTKEGILLLYAGDNKTTTPYYETFAALFDPSHPDKVLHRADRPILQPTQDWERKGYIPNVVFAESLIHDGDRWKLYYGGSDHVIGLAEAPFVASLMHSP